MANGQDESPKRDPSKLEKQGQSQPAGGQPEPTENLSDFLPFDDLPGEDLSGEPTAPFVPIEPAESLESFEPLGATEGFEAIENFEPLEPFAESTEDLAAAAGEPTQPESAAEEVTGAGAEQPGLAETVAFQASDSQVTEALTAAEGAPTAEGIEPLLEGGLLGAGLLGDETATPEPGAEGEATLVPAEQAEAEPEEEEEKGGGILAWVGETSLYNVLLFVAMVALILGSLGLYFELKRYDFDIKAREGKHPVAAATPYGEPITTAMA